MLSVLLTSKPRMTGKSSIYFIGCDVVTHFQTNKSSDHSDLSDDGTSPHGHRTASKFETLHGGSPSVMCPFPYPYHISINFKPFFKRMNTYSDLSSHPELVGSNELTVAQKRSFGELLVAGTCKPKELIAQYRLHKRTLSAY